MKRKKTEDKITKRSPAYDSFKPVRVLFPSRLPGHKLSSDNALNGIVPAEMGVIKEGKFFKQYGWRIMEGWALRGWATAPYHREGRDAIVFEKLVAADLTTGQYFDSREPGLYWTHENADVIKFYSV